MVTTETTKYQPIETCKDFFYGKVKEFFYELRENHTRNTDHNMLRISLINDAIVNTIYAIEVRCTFNDTDNIDTEIMFSGLVLSDESYTHDSFEHYTDIYAFIRKRMYRAFEKIRHTFVSGTFSYGIDFMVHVEIDYDCEDENSGADNQKEKIDDKLENCVEIINTEPNDVALAFYCYRTTKDRLNAAQCMLDNIDMGNSWYSGEYMSKLRNMKSILLHDEKYVISAPYAVSSMIIDSFVDATESMITYRTKIGKDDYYTDNVFLCSSQVAGCTIINMIHVSSYNTASIDISSYIICSLFESNDKDRYLSDLSDMFEKISAHHRVVSLALNNENNTEVFISTEDNGFDFIINKIKKILSDDDNDEEDN